MTGLRPLPARKLLRVLDGLGFAPVGQKGSHVKLRKEGGPTIVVPVHPGRDLKVGLLRKILREAGIDVEDFLSRP